MDTTDRFPRLPETGQRVTDLASLSDTSVVVFGEDRKMPVREAILRGLMERDPYGRLKMSEPTAPAPAASAPAATSTKPLPVLLQTPSYGAVDLSRLQPLDAVLVNGQSMSVVECTVRGILKKAVDGRGYSLVS